MSNSVRTSNVRTVRGYKPGIAIAPGETLKEVLDDRGWTSSDLSSLMKMDEVSVKGLLDGSFRITPAIAESLQRVTDIPATFWMNLEFMYCETIQRLYEEEKAEQEKNAKI